VFAGAVKRRTRKSTIPQRQNCLTALKSFCSSKILPDLTHRTWLSNGVARTFMISFPKAEAPPAWLVEQFFNEMKRRVYKRGTYRNLATLKRWIRTDLKDPY
jgi:hypothetical protein